MSKTITNWKNAPDDISEYFGFVYVIENLVTGQKYIGRKNFWSVTRKKIKDKKRRQVITKESDWRKYKSSSTLVKEEIKRYGEDKFEFTILGCYKNKSAVYYTEVAEQVKRDVLFKKLDSGEYEYYNDNILNRYYRSKMKFE